MMMMLQYAKPSRYYTNTLQNTDEIDSKETKNDQVSINLIDNSIMDYNIKLEDKINEQIDNDIPSIDLIKYNKNTQYDDYNKIITCRIYIKLSTIQRLQKEYKRKYDNDFGISKELGLILDNHLDKVETQLENRTATTSSSCIEYNGATPRIDVLKKLLEIAEQIKNNSPKIFSKLELRRIVKQQKGIRDVRVVKKYQECLFLYAIKMNQANVAYDQFNMTGFRSGVLYLIKSRERKND